MTSTSTYQGMNSEAKPSSRVLAPPGGGSSNIFGSAEPAQPAPKKESAAPTKPVEPAPVSQQSSQGDRAIRAAPKQGEDSFQNLFGSEKCLQYKNIPNTPQKFGSKPDGLSASSNQSSPSTFDSLFGHANVETRKGSATRKSADSYKRLFGHQEEKGSNSKNHKDVHKEFKKLSLSNHDSPLTPVKSPSDHDSSFHRVFGGFKEDSTPARSKRHSDLNSAFNPITGQPYDLPEEKKKEPANEDDEEKEVGKENEQKPDVTTQPPTVSAAKEKTSTRIAQPPGGKSSGPLW